MYFGIIAEGRSDVAVIENILKGKLSVDGNDIQQSRNPTRRGAKGFRCYRSIYPFTPGLPGLGFSHHQTSCRQGKI